MANEILAPDGTVATSESETGPDPLPERTVVRIKQRHYIELTINRPCRLRFIRLGGGRYGVEMGPPKQSPVVVVPADHPALVQPSLGA